MWIGGRTVKHLRNVTDSNSGMDVLKIPTTIAGFINEKHASIPKIVINFSLQAFAFSSKGYLNHRILY